MKKYLLMVPLVLLASCETFQIEALRAPASVKQKHYVFSIHGLGGEPKSLGQLMPLLEEHLTQVDPNTEVITKDFDYSGGEKGADVERFVSQFENFLSKELADVTSDSRDKVTLVTHSQGGLIGTLWYLKAIAGVDLKQKMFAERVNGFVAIGVPFWGSKTTFILKDFIPTEYLQKTIFSALKISDEEVTDITASSEKLYGYFQKFASRNYVNSYYDPRMLSVIGVVPDARFDKPAQKSFFGFFSDIKNKFTSVFDNRLNLGERWESDQAVNVSSGRLGFYYYSDTLYQQILQKKPTEITMKDFDYSRFFKTDPKVIYTQAVHSYASNHPKFAMANVPEECFQPAQCEQVAYVDVFKHVAHCETVESTCNMKAYSLLVNQLEVGRRKITKQTSEDIYSQMRTFSLGLKLTLPKNFVPPKELVDPKLVTRFISADFKHSTEKSSLAVEAEDGLIKSKLSQGWEIRLGRYKEWGGRILHYDAVKNQVNIQLTGNIQMKNKGQLDLTKQYPLQMVVQVPGLKKRYLTIPLRPTYTTFLDLQLE
jgi:pimeloyl-ACP methyl ester carboxylesterase